MSRAGAGRWLLPALCLVFFVGFAALGIWQVQRLQWKLDLIHRVEARLAAQPAGLPPGRDWARLKPRDYDYRRVIASGSFDHRRETLVEALTGRGPGFWVMTPLRTKDGVVLVNRGFVPREKAAPGARPAGQVAGERRLEGLLRASEAGGRVLRPNRPGEGRWYSRDVAAIARARGLGPVAPFFIDAGAAPNPGGYPVGGLTVVAFRNAHLIYALTWFGLAALALAGLVLALRGRRREEEEK